MVRPAAFRPGNLPGAVVGGAVWRNPTGRWCSQRAEGLRWVLSLICPFIVMGCGDLGAWPRQDFCELSAEEEQRSTDVHAGCSVPAACECRAGCVLCEMLSLAMCLGAKDLPPLLGNGLGVRVCDVSEPPGEALINGLVELRSSPLTGGRTSIGASASSTVQVGREVSQCSRRLLSDLNSVAHQGQEPCVVPAEQGRGHMKSVLDELSNHGLLGAVFHTDGVDW